MSYSGICRELYFSKVESSCLYLTCLRELQKLLNLIKSTGCTGRISPCHAQNMAMQNSYFASLVRPDDLSVSPLFFLMYASRAANFLDLLTSSSSLPFRQTCLSQIRRSFIFGNWRSISRYHSILL